MERHHVPTVAGETIVLPAEPASAARAREFVRTLLQGSVHPELEDAAVICVSELVANVTLHTNSRECVVRVVDEHDDILIEVGDDAGDIPVLGAAPSDADHGRGLRIIDALAGEWGVRRRPDHGKQVWLRLGCSVGG